MYLVHSWKGYSPPWQERPGAVAGGVPGCSCQVLTAPWQRECQLGRRNFSNLEEQRVETGQETELGYGPQGLVHFLQLEQPAKNPTTFQVSTTRRGPKIHTQEPVGTCITKPWCKP